jgi:hypothetical protein
MYITQKPSRQQSFSLPDFISNKGQMMSELAEWFTALGTLATAIVAVFISFLPSIRRWYNKPKLRIEFQNEEPFCRIADVIESQFVDQGIKVPKEVRVPHYWIRARIVNVGKSVAKRCEGKLVRIRDAKTMEDRKDFDPVVLRWVVGELNPIDINKTDYEYLNILYTRKDDVMHFFVDSIDVKPRGINLFPERKDYILDIVLYGDNVDPVAKSFYLKNNKEYDRIELSEWNPQSDYEPKVIKMKKGNRTLLPKIAALVPIAVFSLLLLFLSYFWLTPAGVPSPPISMTQRGAEIELQANNDFLIFLGTIFLTSVIGIVTLLQLLKQSIGFKEKMLLSVLYFGLVVGIVYSLSGVLHILRENFSLINSGILENGLRDWLSQTTFFDFYKSIQGVWGTILGLVMVFLFTIVVDLLFIVKVGVWADYNDQSSEERDA